MSAPVRDLVFISYSHRAPEWRDRLLILLKPFVRQGCLQVWADPYIEAGSLWRREVDAALDRTVVGVILLTPDLLASDFVSDVEIPRLLRAARAGLLTLLIVPIQSHAEGATTFADGDLQDFQWPWPADQPVEEIDERLRNRALVTITDAIVNAGTARPIEVFRQATHERTVPAAVVLQARRARVHGLPALPPHYLRRSQVHDAVKTALMGTRPVVGVSASVGVHGEGGLGKTVVAQAIASDEEIARAFPDGIFWVTVGQQPGLESLQAELLERAGAPGPVESVASGQRVLREAFRGRACLVIVDDVWQFAHAQAFDVLDDRSRLLVTTRDRSILTALGAHDMRLDRLSPDLAGELLAAWAGVTPSSLPPEAATVAQEVDFLPLALSLAGAQIRDSAAWRDLLGALQAGNLVYLDHPYGSVFKSIQASLDALHGDDARRYIELAVFPAAVEVPVSVVTGLWQTTAGLDREQGQSLVTRLAARNLVRVAEGGDMDRRVALHDVPHDFVKLMVSTLPDLHAHLVEGWRAELRSPAEPTHSAAAWWATLPPAPRYRWQFLAHHLARAGREDEVGDVLTSLTWLSTKVQYFPITAVVADYEEVSMNPGLRRIRDALLLSAHVLSMDPSALPAQLTGRLTDDGDARVWALLDAAHGMLREESRLRPAFACLTQPGGSLVRMFEGHNRVVRAVAVLPDGHRALSASDDRTLKLWDLATGQVLQTFEGHRGSVRAVTALPDGRRALSASVDQTLKLWNLATGQVLQTFEGHRGGVRALTVLPDGHRALSASEDRTLKLWDLTTSQVLQAFEGHRGGVRAVTVLPDGHCALSASEDHTLKLWDLTTGQLLRTFEGHSGPVRAVAVLPDGHRALSASDDRTLKLWDLGSGHVLQTLEGHSRGARAVTVLPDGHRALSAGSDHTLKLWDLATGQVLQTLEGHSSGVTAVTVLPDGRRALSAGSDHTLKLWDLATSQVFRTVERHRDWVKAVTMLPDGHHALSASEDHTLKLWSLATGQVIKTFEGSNGPERTVTVLPNGRRALSAGSDQMLKLWDVSTGQILQTFEGHTRAVNAVAIVPARPRVISASDDQTLKLWDLTTGQVLQTFEGHSEVVQAVSVLPDGGRALSASFDRTLKLWDLATGRLLQTFEGHTGPVRALTVLPDGRRALSTGSDQTLKLWDLATGQVLQTFEGHSGHVRAVTVLPDGRRALSGGFDRTLKLWDLATGQVQTAFYDDAPVLCLSEFTQDWRVVIGNALGRVYILEMG